MMDHPEPSYIAFRTASRVPSAGACAVVATFKQSDYLGCGGNMQAFTLSRTTLLSFVVFSTISAGCGGSQGARANVSGQPMPRGGTFTGVYFSPQYGRMEMVQSGRSVIGEYSKDDRSGRLEGYAVGNLLRFEWTEKRELISERPTVTKGKGYFRYLEDADGDHKLVGEWGHELDELGGGPWNAVKSKRLKPKMLQEGRAPAANQEEIPLDSEADEEPIGDDKSLF